MRTIIITFILTILTFYSCKTTSDQQIEKGIVGEWSFAKTEDIRKAKNSEILLPPSFGSTTIGYIFFENKSCLYKPGFFKTIKGSEFGNRKTFYFGNTTKYKIENDNLEILNLSDSTWSKQKIVSIIRDTLTFQVRDSVYTKYVRAKYILDPFETYDKIIVSSSGCYGSCPILDISIDKNGDVLYFGKSYNTQNGFYTSKITNEEFQKIETTFKKADIQDLKNNYKADWTDDETVTITIIKNNKIIKTITDYGRRAPPELILAYTPVRFLYQQIKLIPFTNDKFKLPIGRISFETGQHIFNLTKSESFYLSTEMFKGKEVTQKFENKYKIEYWNDNDKKEVIFSDGRFYKNTDKTIDIGYNFLKDNHLTGRFRKKNEYER